jgi:hypothetical protein
MFFTRKKKAEATKPKISDLKIVEHVAGNWSYHLSVSGKSGQPALCGCDDVMCTNSKLATWGFTSHLHEKYCTACMAVVGNMLEKKGE